MHTIAKSMSTLRNISKRIQRFPLLTLTAGFAIGALTNIYPVIAAIVFGLIAFPLLVHVIREEIRSKQSSSLSEWEKYLLQPDPHAISYMKRANEHYLAVGQAIETIPHPNLNTRSALSELGWEPSQVRLHDTQQQFDATRILESAGGYQEFDPPNGVKFCLTGTSFITTDSPNLAMDVRRTNYFTLRSILSTVRESFDVRTQFGSLEPPLNLIPHSLCLHYVVRLSDGNVLCMKRDPRTPYHGNLWSFSGEEQLSVEDFAQNTPTLSFFQRTLCEEVFALRQSTPLHDRWREIDNFVDTMKLWSVFVEEKLFNYSLLGVYQLSQRTSEFVSFHNALVDKGIGNRDREGVFFVAPPRQLNSLLLTGKCEVTALFSNDTQQVETTTLHPTSRYRVFRLARAVNRGPLDSEL